MLVSILVISLSVSQIFQNDNYEADDMKSQSLQKLVAAANELFYGYYMWWYVVKISVIV